MSEFNILNSRPIIDILIGDEKLISFEGKDRGLPYLSGPNLCELSTSFGNEQTYEWGGGNLSRWMYMSNLLLFLDKYDRIPELLKNLFNFSHFEDSLRDLNDVNKIKSCYNEIVDKAIAEINASLFFSHKEMKKIGEEFYIVNIGEAPIIEAPKIKKISLEYVRELPERIRKDLESHEYDSVVTKSRTLIEEVFIYIIEDHSSSEYDYNGNLIALFNQSKHILGMQHQSQWDKRINELLSGLEKIVNSIASMRNANSDAHGVGSSRISIKEREAKLIANAATMVSEYYLSVYCSQKEKKIPNI